MFKYLLYVSFVIADIVFYVILRDLDFATENKNLFVILSMANEPIYFGCIGLSFLSLRKANTSAACVIAAVPLIVTALYYVIFR